MWVVSPWKVSDLSEATTGGVAGAGACAAGGVGSAAVCVVHWCCYVDDVFFAVGVCKVRGPHVGGSDAGRLRARREGAEAMERSRKGTGDNDTFALSGT